jgi:hypothetical protein
MCGIERAPAIGSNPFRVYNHLGDPAQARAFRASLGLTDIKDSSTRNGLNGVRRVLYTFEM